MLYYSSFSHYESKFGRIILQESEFCTDTEREREREITSLQSLKKILLLESPFCIKSKKRGHSLIRKSRLYRWIPSLALWKMMLKIQPQSKVLHKHGRTVALPSFFLKLDRQNLYLLIPSQCKKGFTMQNSEHQYWWWQKLSNLVPQKTILSILPLYFIKHKISVILF